MRRLIVFNLVTLDGFFEGPGREIDWHNVDDEFNDQAVAMLDSADTLLFGRVTYELMARFWPTADAIRLDPIVAGRMNGKEKIVFSRTLERADWSHTRLVKGGMEQEVERLKLKPGKALLLLGSGNVMSQLAQQGMIDEYRLMMNPLVLGKGNPLFQGMEKRLDLTLAGVRGFHNGNVLLTYQPRGKG